MNDIKTPEELLDFMSKNTNYGYLGQSGRIYHYDDVDFDSNWFNDYILESSDEFFKYRYGNCWDQVEFERNWFLQHGYEIKTIYEMVLLDYDNNYPSHSFLIYKDNNSWCWFENADFNNRGIHRFNTFKELLEFQYKKYLAFLKEFNISKEEIDRIIMTDFDKPKENISASEYLNHVINSKMIFSVNENTKLGV